MAFIRKLIILFLLLCFQFGFSQNDCLNAIVSCGNTSFNNLSVQGAGIQEVTGANSCGSGENNSLWIKVTIKTDGTLGFLITPESTFLSADFDFFVFGPDASCESLGTSIRCSTTNPIASGSNSNLTGMIDTESDWWEGPSEMGNNYVQWLDVLVGETYFIVIDRALGNGNFSLEWTGTATFSEPPVVNQSLSGALNLELCDSDAISDELTEFDLTQSGNLAIGSQSNMIATYHLTENDAIVGTNAIANPTAFSNTTNPQTLFIRVQNSITSCFSTASFILNVIPFSVPDLIDLQECDNDNNGFAVFNLSVIRNLLTANPNNAVSFHHSNTDPISLPDLYTNQTAFTNEVIWVKIYNSVTGCTIYKSFNIILNSAPTVVASQITQCDFEIFPDGMTTFNLSQANSVLTNGDNSLTTQFYLNPTDAINNQNALNTTFNNTTNPQTLTVKVTNPSTGCYSLTQLTLNVSLNPTTTVTLQSCDDNAEDGIASFNLADAGFEVNGNSASYYYNINDALMEQNPITTNQFSGQDIYARVENGNDCIGIHIIRLEVSAIPQTSVAVQGILCANLPNHPVTLHTIINTPGNYDFYWSPNGANTQNISVFQPGDYTVTVTDVLSSCAKTVTVHLDASEAPIIDTVEVHDLVQINSVTVLVNGNGDYWYSLDGNSYQPTNFFSPVLPGQHIVSVQDMNGCGTIYQTVFVLGIPHYFTPNGDGYQDYWQIKGLDLTVNGNSKIYIFNRYGKVLTQFGPQDAWDGTYNGHQMPADDYWYSIQFEDGRNAKGHFALKR
ncbi:T9SS type B sorting domain-containing protein [Flavobacterium terrisoli]|uniref:T9SS type B sorting domain-containing protein n=1 Tax=Flavobacterium terrisoli TaxID=3242195 RepID=UPI0025439FCB|nr:T9SS type B sorting domain-containing protein [Flavobacterium buctense]